MRILGIDPGTAICGYGCVEWIQGRLRPIAYGAIRTGPELPLEKRLLLIHERLQKLLTELQPERIGVEQLFFNRNVTTAMAVGQARGVILLAAAQANLPNEEYTPGQIKQAVTGYGKADKGQVTGMTVRLLGLKETPKPDDVADALAIAICTAHCCEQRNVWPRR